MSKITDKGKLSWTEAGLYVLEEIKSQGKNTEMLHQEIQRLAEVMERNDRRNNEAHTSMLTALENLKATTRLTAGIMGGAGGVITAIIAALGIRHTGG